MSFVENNYFKFLIDVLKDKEIESIFISSWDSIYTISKEGYIKINFSFENEDNYTNLVEEMIVKYSNKSDKDLYINSFKNIDIYLHKWNKNSYWTTLIKR